MKRLSVCTFISFTFLLPQVLIGADFELITTPADAEVFVYEQFGEKPTKAGNTPLKMDIDQLQSYTQSKTFYTLEIQKPGFETLRFIMMKIHGADLKLNLKMEVSREISNVKKHDKLMSDLFEVQKIVRARNFGDAIAKLKILERDYPNFSIINELMGISYYMNKDIENALSMFRLAFSKNPDNSDAFKMKVYLEKKLGIDTEVGK